MITKQQQRIEQIERWLENYVSANSDPYMGLQTAFAELRFLLSLVKGQEAEYSRLLSEIKEPRCNDCEAVLGDNWCANCAGKLMLSLCVEKVKSMRDERLRDLHAFENDDNHKDEADYERAVVFVLTNVIKELESLSIQEQK